jgi:TPR repeat protein
VAPWLGALVMTSPGCQKSGTPVAEPTGCFGARCVEEAEAALYYGDDAAAREPLALVCEKGDGFQCFRLAALYEEGRGGPVDLAKAAKAFEDACAADYSEGCERRYELAAKQEGGAEVELEFAIKACEGARRSGCTYAGDMMRDGRGVATDRARAADLYEKGCGLGDVDGCVRAGDLLLDPALPWESQARGIAAYIGGCVGYNSYACVRVGVAMYEGTGMPPTPDRAAAQFKKACEMSDEDGCHLTKQLEEAGGKTVALELTSTASVVQSGDLIAHELACRSSARGEEALRKALAGLSAFKPALDACTKSGVAVKMEWRSEKGKISGVKIPEDKRLAGCVSAALRKARTPPILRCEGLILLGAPEEAAAAAAAIAEAKAAKAAAIKAAAAAKAKR